MLPSSKYALREYLDITGRSPYADWFNRLSAPAAAKVAVAAIRLSQGDFSNVKSVGAGIHEFKIDFGPGYRIYFAKDGESTLLLLGGGTKKRQARDIADALSAWRDYKNRKESRR